MSLTNVTISIFIGVFVIGLTIIAWRAITQQSKKLSKYEKASQERQKEMARKERIIMHKEIQTHISNDGKNKNTLRTRNRQRTI